MPTQPFQQLSMSTAPYTAQHAACPQVAPEKFRQQAIPVLGGEGGICGGLMPAQAGEGRLEVRLEQAALEPVCQHRRPVVGGDVRARADASQQLLQHVHMRLHICASCMQQAGQMTIHAYRQKSRPSACLATAAVSKHVWLSCRRGRMCLPLRAARAVTSTACKPSAGRTSMLCGPQRGWNRPLEMRVHAG